MADRLGINERFALLDQLPTGESVINDRFLVVFWNVALEEWTGVRRDYLLGSDIRVRFPALSTPAYSERLADTFALGLPAVFSPELHEPALRSENKGGQKRVIRATVVAVPDGNGRFLALFTFEDLSDLTSRLDETRRMRDRALREIECRKKIEAELFAATQDLARTLERLKEAQTALVHREKMATLGQMTAGVAHEINNPVAFVLSNHEILKRDLDDLMRLFRLVRRFLPEIAAALPDIAAVIDARAKDIGLEHLLESVRRRTDNNIDGLHRIRRIVADLSDFSRFDKGDWRWADLESTIESVIRFLGPMMKPRGVIAQTGYAPAGPVWCCPGALHQAFSNVLANAIQASADGGKVTIHTVVGNGVCRVVVGDEGSGIASEHMSRLFEPFFTTKPAGVGTGLGLPITQQIVSLHRGRIDITSRPGSGTVVTMELPLTRVSPEQRND